MGRRACRVVAVGAFALVVFLVVLWGVFHGTADAMVKISDNRVSPDERARILVRLQERNLPYDLRGGEIYARPEDAENVLLALFTDGIYTNRMLLDRVSAFDQGVDRWKFGKRHQVALQRKLERMIRHLVPVAEASVCITPGTAAIPASASIQVELDGTRDALWTSDIALIAALVSRVAGDIAPERVCITDTHSRAYRVSRD